MGGKSSPAPKPNTNRAMEADELAAARRRDEYGKQFATDRVAALTSTAETAGDTLGTTLGTGLLGG
jgi:hypothetical protein